MCLPATQGRGSREHHHCLQVSQCSLSVKLFYAYIVHPSIKDFMQLSSLQRGLFRNRITRSLRKQPSLLSRSSLPWTFRQRFVPSGEEPASYPDASFSMKMCAQRKAGRRQQASPAVCILPMVPCGSSPVTRVLRSPLPQEKRSAWGGGWEGTMRDGCFAS